MADGISQEEILSNMELIKKAVNMFDEPRRAQVIAMLDGPVGESYFVSPASSRVEYHSAYPGGLAAHSLNVVRHLYKLTAALCPDVYDKKTLTFVGLFHDLGKVGDGVHEYYVPNKSDWHRERGMAYETNKSCVHMPTSERSLYILQSHGIKLTSDEYLAIRLNDGQYVEENRSYRMKEPDLALLVHFADMWSTKQEK